jgi:integrase
MEIDAKVFKRRSGKSAGKWTARVEYFDNKAGKVRTLERIRARRSEAIDERDKLVADLEKSHGGIREGQKMTFAQLADHCEERLFKKAVIVEGRKIEGVRSHETVKSYLTVLREFFGKRKIGQILTEDLQDYRNWRLKIGSRRQSAIKKGEFVPIKLTTINRELSTMRSMMRYALSQGWVTRDIFFRAGVINVAAEVERHRILNKDEETRLLAACGGEREATYERTRFGKKETITMKLTVDNPYLKAIILLAVDAGLRRGEILKLRWEDIDFGKNLIHIVATHTKTERARMVPLTDRAKAELLRVQNYSVCNRPFPISEFKTSWQTAKRIARIDDLHFHDLRRTALTRWQSLGLPLAVAGKLAGHTNLQTTMKHYTGTDAETIRNLTDTMNALHCKIDEETPDPAGNYVM